MNYAFSKKYIVRQDAHLDQYVLYKYGGGRGQTTKITHFDYCLLELLRAQARNITTLHRALIDTDLIGPGQIAEEHIRKIVTYFENKQVIVRLEGLPNKRGEARASADLSGIVSPCIAQRPVPVLTVPQDLTLFLTRMCNMRCVHCNASAGAADPNELDVEQWKRIIDQAEAARVLKLTLIGGEPTLYRGFWELCDYLKKKKISKTLFTNLSLLEEREVKRIKECNMGVSVSIDGADSQTHDVFRRTPGSFERIRKTLPLFKKWEVDYWVGITLHQKNVHQIERFVEMLSEYSPMKIGFFFLEPLGRGVQADGWKLDHAVLEEVKERCRVLQEQYPSMKIESAIPADSINGAPNNRPQLYCRAGTETMAIDSDGMAYPCLIGAYAKRLPVGSALDSSIREIWESNRWGMFRGETTVDQIEGCRECLHNHQCAERRCRVRSALNGDVYSLPTSCPIPLM